MNLSRSTVLKCSRDGCRNIFPAMSPLAAVLEVRLGDATRFYNYCCKKHLEEQLGLLNSKATPFDIRLKIDETHVISERNPFVMKVFLSEELKKVDVNVFIKKIK